jgi:hypothetical protein
VGFGDFLCLGLHEFGFLFGPTKVVEVIFFLLEIVGGGWSPIFIHSALRPPIGLLCQPRVILMMDKLVE